MKIGCLEIKLGAPWVHKFKGKANDCKKFSG